MSTVDAARRAQFVASLEDKSFRDLYAEEWIETGLLFQIRTIREDRGWTQRQLGERIGMTQTGISRLENASYGRYSIATLKRLAAAFDVALVVRFAPFSELADWMDRLSPEDLAVPDFEHDPGLAPDRFVPATELTASARPPVKTEMKPELPS